MSKDDFAKVAAALALAEERNWITTEQMQLAVEQLSKDIALPVEQLPTRDHCVLITVLGDVVGAYGPMIKSEADIWVNRTIENWGSDKKVTGGRIMELLSPALGNRNRIGSFEEQQQEIKVETHGTPPDGRALTPCCNKTSFELPRDSQMTNDPAAVTCGRKFNPIE